MRVEHLLIAALAWGAFAFGAVYPWAYWPLAAAASTVGIAGLAIGRRGPAPRLGGRVFRLRVKLRRTTVALAKVVRPAR